MVEPIPEVAYNSLIKTVHNETIKLDLKKPPKYPTVLNSKSPPEKRCFNEVPEGAQRCSEADLSGEGKQQPRRPSHESPPAELSLAHGHGESQHCLIVKICIERSLTVVLKEELKSVFRGVW